MTQTKLSKFLEALATPMNINANDSPAMLASLIFMKGLGNYKLPLLFVLMLLPLVFHGGGRLSLDRVLLTLTNRTDRVNDSTCDATAAGLALLVLGLATVFVEAYWGATLFIASALLIAPPAFLNRK